RLGEPDEHRQGAARMISWFRSNLTRLRCESGQALVVVALFGLSLIVAAALTVDVGAWYRDQRQAQTTADAAALAGAQVLPADPSRAFALATTYGNTNGGGIDAPGGITFASTFAPNDTLTVKVTRQSPGFL